jgi:hypothetical protein
MCGNVENNGGGKEREFSPGVSGVQWTEQWRLSAGAGSRT